MDSFSQSERIYMNKLADMSISPFLTNEEIIYNIRSYRKNKDSNYLNIIINNFIKLLIQKARKYKRKEIDIGDLIHYGIDGLIEAVDWSFNLDTKVKFITYITIIIERRMKDGLDTQKSPVKLPKNIMTQQRKIRNNKNSRNLIYSKLNVDKFEDFENFIPVDDFSYSIDLELDHESLQFDIYRILNLVLLPIERDIIIHNFGLNGESAKALDTISNLLNLSTQKVRKLYTEALMKLKCSDNSLSILKKYRN
jgi:RNA polymerase sigma factor (sigma-70 family)